MFSINTCWVWIRTWTFEFDLEGTCGSNCHVCAGRTSIINILVFKIIANLIQIHGRFEVFVAIK